MSRIDIFSTVRKSRDFKNPVISSLDPICSKYTCCKILFQLPAVDCGLLVHITCIQASATESMTPKRQDSAAQTSVALYALAVPSHHMTDKQNPLCEPATHWGDQHANTFCHPGSRYSSIWQREQEHLRHRLF